jgi:hypothetical protein
MIPTINEIFFYLTTLFAMSPNFVSEKTNITIDLASKTGQIEYVDLKTQNTNADMAEAGLKEINSTTKFDEYFSQLKITSKKIYKKKNKLNATLNFSYKNQNELFELLYFSLDNQGRFLYPILLNEKMISSNGELTKEGQFRYIQWDKEINKIELTLKLVKAGDKDFDNLISISRYWEIDNPQ